MLHCMVTAYYLGLLWDIFNHGVSAASCLASAWLLCACWRSRHNLVTLQLWHLALADLGQSVVDPIYEICLATIWSSDSSNPPKMFTDISRTAAHFFLVSVCVVEVEIAAGIATSALHSTRASKSLARLLPWNWALSIMCAVLDFMTMHTKIIPDSHHDVAGSSPVVAVIVCVSFFLSFVLYIIAVVAVTCIPSPSLVVGRASFRALAYPFGFMATLFPVTAIYMGIVPNACYMVWLKWAYPCLYSNGLVNATVYGLQTRFVALRRHDATEPPKIAEPRRDRVACGSFHVGFGEESLVSAEGVAAAPLQHHDNMEQLDEADVP